MALPEDDDGYPGRFDPNDDLLHVVVPDDLRDLQPEIAAYRRELEVARRKERRRIWRLRFLPKWARGGLPSPVFTAILLVVAITGLLLSVFAPVTQEPRHLPISSLASPKAAPGTVGGLLPVAELVASDGRRIQTRGARPAVLVLVPAGCQCAAVIHQVVGQVNEVLPAPYAFIVSAGTDTSATTLAEAKDGANNQALGVRDVKGVLAKYYSRSTSVPTLVLVEGDGVTRAPQVFHAGDQLKDALKTLHF